MTHTINVPPLRKALEHVTEHPEEHDQTIWARRTKCGTTGCLAYWITVYAGYEARWPNAVTVHTNWTTANEPIRDTAAREVGLTRDQADQLFEMGNTIDNLWTLAEAYTDGEITRPESAGTP